MQLIIAIYLKFEMTQEIEVLRKALIELSIVYFFPHFHEKFARIVTKSHLKVSQMKLNICWDKTDSAPK